MSHEAITGYLREYNTAIDTGAPLPGTTGLTSSEAARVTRFLANAAPERALAAGRSAVRRAAVAPVAPEVTMGSIGDDNAGRLAEFAAGLQAPIAQEGEQ